MEGAIANVRSGAIDAMAIQIDGSAKCSTKLIKLEQANGRIIGEDFEARGHPIDTDSDGIEHPPSYTFATQ